ncbi:hypothetical protein BH10PAT3_BH10PAT3_4320 [soil metagenome]
MSDEQLPAAGFNKPRKPSDDWVVNLYIKYDLSEEASLEDIEPVALGLWQDRTTRLSAAELVLGRHIEFHEFTTDPYLGSLLMTEDAYQAFGGLLFVKTIEEMAAESPDTAK